MKFAINLIFLYNRKGDSMSNSNKTAKEALHNYKDRTGQKYGRLLAIKYLYTNKRKKAVWLCKCECGKYIEVPSDNLAIGNTKSCGCLHSDMSKEKIKKIIENQTKYKKPHQKHIITVFNQIKTRCYNENCKAYKNYGGRGIKVCDKWLDNPNSFYEWSINNGYKKGLSIDRIDVNKDYEPNNCRWITNLEQQNNKRNNKYLEFNGEKHTYAEWSRIFNIPTATISDRVRRGFTIEKILNTNYKKRI